MIQRLVKLTFRPDATDDFIRIYWEARPHILARAGCLHVELWQDRQQPELFFTYSRWAAESDLDAYRHSDFFRTTWSQTKALFAAPPEAWSLDGH